MPVSLLNTDTSFPTFENGTSVEKRVEVLTDYLYMLLEELRYTFGNLGEENFNDQALRDLSIKVSEPIEVRVQSTEKTLAEIKISAEQNNTFISQMVQAVGDDGKITAASIVAAINGAGSSVKIEADHVAISGFVTFESLEENGGSTINGNNVSLILDASNDDGYTNLNSKSSLNFVYRTNKTKKDMARIYTTVDGSDTDVTSRYALHIDAISFRNNENTIVYPAIKMSAKGRISIEGDSGVYVAALLGGYIMLDAEDNTRIVAYVDYDESNIKVGRNTYAFCTDGIYYNGNRIVSV